MSQGFLEQEAQRAKKLRRNATFFLLFAFIGLIVICYVYKGSLDVRDEKNSRLFGYLVFLAGTEGIGLLFGIFNWIRVLVRGNDLVIPFK